MTLRYMKTLSAKESLRIQQRVDVRWWPTLRVSTEAMLERGDVVPELRRQPGSHSKPVHKIEPFSPSANVCQFRTVSTRRWHRTAILDARSIM